MTPLETTLLGVFGTLLVGVSVRIITQRQMVSREECTNNHKHETDRHNQVMGEIQSLRSEVKTQNKMIRALVVHSNISREQQESILNEKNGS